MFPTNCFILISITSVLFLEGAPARLKCSSIVYTTLNNDQSKQKIKEKINTVWAF